jgi:hypothetical protein
MKRLAIHLDGAGVEIDDQLAGTNQGIGVPLRAANDGLNSGDQLALVERLGEVVVGPHTQPLDLVIEAVEATQDKNGRLNPRRS